MKKKFLSLVLALVMLLSLVACGNKNEPATDPVDPPPVEDDTPIPLIPPMNPRKLLTTPSFPPMTTKCTTWFSASSMRPTWPLRKKPIPPSTWA